MKFQHKLYKTLLYLAVEKENVEIIRLLLSKDKIYLNIPYIEIYIIIKFKNISINYIQYQNFK